MDIGEMFRAAMASENPIAILLLIALILVVVTFAVVARNGVKVFAEGLKLLNTLTQTLGAMNATQDKQLAAF